MFIFTLLLFYFLTGFYVVPPALLNKGYTYWFLRVGTGYPFLSSPASFLKRSENFNSLNLNLKKVLKFPENRIILKFKYSKTLYSLIEKK